MALSPIPPQPGTANDPQHFVGRRQTMAVARAKLAHRLLVAALAPLARPDLPADLASDPRCEPVLEALAEDHYLVIEGGTIRWRYATLRDIYARRRGLEIVS